MYVSPLVYNYTVSLIKFSREPGSVNEGKSFRQKERNNSREILPKTINEE